LTFGAGPNDMIGLTQSVNSPAPVGGEAAYPIRVMVTSADGSTPVRWRHRTMERQPWRNSDRVQRRAPSGSVLTDDSGKVETRVDVGAVGTSTLTAMLAPAHSPAKLGSGQHQRHYVSGRSRDLHPQGVGRQGRNRRRATHHPAALEWEPGERKYHQFPTAFGIGHAHGV
jgi:hypothetical protein